MKSCVIIIAYNGMRWINECLQSILNSSISATIIVVDNCSSDSTVDHIKTNFSTVILLEQSENLGFGRANNIAMAYALQAGMDYVFLLNQDAFVYKNSFANLIHTAVQHPEYGILSPIQLGYSGDVLENYFFQFMAKDKSRSFYSDFVLKKQPKVVYDIAFIQAACWLLPVASIKKVGGFDPIFFHYGEDNNYCQRILYHNLKIGVVSEAYIRHDANNHKEEKIKVFSEKYFHLYSRNLKVLFADINEELNEGALKYEKMKIYKVILFHFFKLNVSKVYGCLKKLKVLDETVKQILVSRKINKAIDTHYLDV